MSNNIAKDVGNVKKKQNPVDFWTKEEFELVVSTFDLNSYYDHYSFTIIYLLFMTGLRLGEAQALTWSDIDFQNGSLNVNKSMYYQNAKSFYTHPPKTKAGIRLISLDVDTLEILKQWKEVQRKNLGSVIFILSYNGLPTNKSTVSHIIKRHSKLANIHRIKVHALRHSHASLLISLGESALVIKDRLGHEDIDTTLGTYGHLYPNINYQVAQKLSHLIDLRFEKKERKFTSNQFINHGGKNEKKSSDN